MSNEQQAAFWDMFRVGPKPAPRPAPEPPKKGSKRGANAAQSRSNKAGKTVTPAASRASSVGSVAPAAAPSEAPSTAASEAPSTAAASAGTSTAPEAPSTTAASTAAASNEQQPSFVLTAPEIPLQPQCTKCKIAVDPLRAQITGKGPGHWKCSSCNTKGVQLHRIFGKWPPRSVHANAAEWQEKFWRSLEGVSGGAALERHVIQQLTIQRIEQEEAMVGG